MSPFRGYLILMRYRGARDKELDEPPLSGLYNSQAAINSEPGMRSADVRAE